LSNRYTLRAVQPNTTDSADDVVADGDAKNLDPSAISTEDGQPFTDEDKYLSYGTPTAYQQPITVRFGVKGSF
jgi:hypothetical protein